VKALSDYHPENERRKEHIQLNQVMDDVRMLESSTIALAQAVAKIIPDQIQIGVSQIRLLFKQIVAALLILFFLLVAYSVMTIGRLNAHLDRNRDVITCFQKVAEGSRTDAALLLCKQGAGG
jgi:hypothetical protein